MTEKSDSGQFRTCEFCKCNTNARIRRCCKIGTIVDEGRIQAEKYKQQLMFHDSHTPAPAMTMPECMQKEAYLKKEDEKLLNSILPLHLNSGGLIAADQPTPQSNASDTTLESAKDIDDAYSTPFTYMPSYAAERPVAGYVTLQPLELIDGTFPLSIKHMPSYPFEHSTGFSNFKEDLIYSLEIDDVSVELRAMLYESNE